MWKKVSRRRDLFMIKYKSFLESDFEVQFDSNNDDSGNDDPLAQSHNDYKKLSKGRPRLSYDEGSTKTKKRRSEELACSCSEEELTRALALKKNQSANDSATETTDHEKNDNINNVLAMYVDLQLSKKKYEKLRIHGASINPGNVYPTYAAIMNAKTSCYPEHIEVSDSGASVHIISLMEHTTKRILAQLNQDKFEELRDKKLLLIGKWGMDGASGQQTTRQKWNSRSSPSMKNVLMNDMNTYVNDIENVNDAAVFMISFFPLQLKSNNLVIWNNETPNSPFFCRPIKFQFIKENDSLVREEYRHYTKLLENVTKFDLKYEDISFEVTFDLKCTMIDGKVCHVLTGQKASNRCNICAVGPKMINDLSYVNDLPCNAENYKFGLSTLHCWIRFMEYLLHISYNLELKKGFVRTKEEKDSKKTRKTFIQKSLKKLSITVDVVKQGAGTTNTGNVARSFFAQAESVAAASGLSEDLIKRLHNILQVLTCGNMVDCRKFENYCLRTAELCVELYPWYKLPPSVHNVLIHGSKIIESLELPIGWLSEEPQEASNKIFRKARAYNSRMCERKLTNEDIMHQLLISSDPLISSLRIKDDKKKKALSTEVEELLLKSD